MLIIFNEHLEHSCSYLQFCWNHGSMIPFKTFRYVNFEEEFSKIYSENEYYVSFSFKHPLMMEKENFMYISDVSDAKVGENHFLYGVNSLDSNKFVCKKVVENCSSIPKLLYKKFSKKGQKFSDEQKSLISLVDDFCSDKRQFPQSYQLNCLFQKNCGGNWDFSITENFCKRFYDGFDEFSISEKEIVKSHVAEWNEHFDDLNFYSLETEESFFISTISDGFYDECYQFMLSKNPEVIAMILNPKTGRLSFKRNLNFDMNLFGIAKELCYDIQGYEFNCSGIPNEFFLERFSRNMEPFCF